MTIEFTPYAYLILFGLYETADIRYCDYKNGTLLGISMSNKELQRQTILNDRHQWFNSLNNSLNDGE